MNQFRRLPVTLVIVDAGPLISLAACGRLDLLDSFDRKVRIVDVVKAECLRDPNKVGFTALKQWFEHLDGQRYAIEATPLLDDWQDAVAQEAAGDQTRPSAQIGDAAVSLAISRYASLSAGREVILLLLEDGPFGDTVVRVEHPEVYALSTRAFLKTLENFGRVHSATQIIEEIRAAGRRVSPYAADRPGRLAPSTRSEWTSALDEQHASVEMDQTIRRVLAEIVVGHAQNSGLPLPSPDMVERLVLYATQDQLRHMVEEMHQMTDVAEFVREHGVQIPGYNT